MRLNPDCIRDILLSAEDTIEFGKSMRFPSDQPYPLLSKYTVDEVLYHIKQCEISGLLTKVNWTHDPACYISDISPSGHQFLANIRSDNNWLKTKEIASKVGSYSLDILSQIAVNVVSSLIKPNT